MESSVVIINAKTFATNYFCSDVCDIKRFKNHCQIKIKTNNYPKISFDEERIVITYIKENYICSYIIENVDLNKIIFEIENNEFLINIFN